MLFNYADMSRDHKHCDGADIVFLVCYVTFREHMFKGLFGFIEWKPVTLSHHLAMFVDRWSSGSEYTKYLTCHMTLQNHVIEGSSNFMSGSSSLYITTLPSLLAIGIIVVDI